MQKIKAGFTLIELLVVVLIIGILSAVALPQYQKAVDKARLTEAIILGKHIRDLEKVYQLANGTYTNSFVDLGMETPGGYTTVGSNTLSKGDTIFQLESALYSGQSDRIVYYYGRTAKNNQHLALFFPYASENIQCYAYTPYGQKLCATLSY